MERGVRHETVIPQNHQRRVGLQLGGPILERVVLAEDLDIIALLDRPAILEAGDEVTLVGEVASVICETATFKLRHRFSLVHHIIIIPHF